MKKFFRNLSVSLRRNKKLKYGGYSFLVTVLFIAVVVVLNIIVTSLHNNFSLQKDMTQSQLYTVDEKTKAVVNNLDQDVYIYTLYNAGYQVPQFNQIINLYVGLSNHIKVENIDPDRSPAQLANFQTTNSQLATGSIIVSSADRTRYRVLDPNAQTTTDENGNVTQINLESSLTSAIDFINSGYMPNAYFIEGHGEKSPEDSFTIRDQFEKENYNVDNLNVAVNPEKAKPGDILVVLDPVKDFSDDEREVFKSLMDKGGRIIFVFDPNVTVSADLHNIESLLNLYGLKLKSGVVCESDVSKFISSAPLVVPTAGTHVIMEPMAGSSVPVIVPLSGAIEEDQNADVAGLTITNLLTSSSTSWMETDFANFNWTKDQGEPTGPFNLAVVAEKDNFTDNDADKAKVAVFYSPDFTDESLSRTNNMNVFMNTAAWMKDASKEIYIRGKSTSTGQLIFNNYGQIMFIVILTAVIIPVILLILGIVVYLRRKNL